jgi:hypothetical protein
MSEPGDGSGYPTAPQPPNDGQEQQPYQPVQPPSYPADQPYQPVQQPPGPPQQYGQPYAPGQPYPYAGGQPYGYPVGQPPYQQQPSKKKTWLIAVLAAVVAVAVAVTLIVVLTTSDDHQGDAKTANRTVSLPASFGAYHKLDSVNAASLRDQIAGQLSSLGAGSGAANNAKVAAYATSGAVPQVIFLGFRVKDVPRLQSQVNDDGIEASVKQFTDGVAKGVSGQGGQSASSPKAFDAGTLGGAMRCQAATLSEKSVGLCGWGDRSYFALTLVIDQPSAAKTATVTRQLRQAAEH